MYTVEFSLSQGAWHVDRLERTLQINRENTLSRNTANDYRILALFETDEEADKFIDEFEPRLLGAGNCQILTL